MGHFQIIPLQQICSMLRPSSMAGSGGTSLVFLAVPGAESLMLFGEGWKGLVGAGVLCSRGALFPRRWPVLPESTRGQEWSPTPAVSSQLLCPSDSTGEVFSVQGSWLLMETDKLIISRKASVGLGLPIFLSLPHTPATGCLKMEGIPDPHKPQTPKALTRWSLSRAHRHLEPP